MKTKVRRKLFLLFTVAGLSPFSSAQNDRVPDIQIYTGDNSKPSYEYHLDDLRKIFFGSDDFTIQFHQDSNQTFRFDGVRCIRFNVGNASSIDAVPNDPEGVCLGHNGHALIVRNCPKPSELCIYDLTGRKVAGTQVQDNAELSTDDLQAGIYIATIQHQSIKFIQQ